MADQLITRAELASFLQVPEVDNATADLAINAATAKVQEAAMQRLVAVAGDEVTIPGSGDLWLVLPEGPVTAVTEVLIGSTVVTDYTLVADVRTGRARLWRARGWRTYLNTGVTYPTPPLVAVTYSHGYTAGDQRLELARDYVLRLAAFRWSNSGAAESLAIDDYRVTYGDTEPLRALTRADRSELRRAYGPTAGTAVLAGRWV